MLDGSRKHNTLEAGLNTAPFRCAKYIGPAALPLPSYSSAVPSRSWLAVEFANYVSCWPQADATSARPRTPSGGRRAVAGFIPGRRIYLDGFTAAPMRMVLAGRAQAGNLNTHSAPRHQVKKTGGSGRLCLPAGHGAGPARAATCRRGGLARQGGFAAGHARLRTTAVDRRAHPAGLLLLIDCCGTVAAPPAGARRPRFRPSLSVRYIITSVREGSQLLVT